MKALVKLAGIPRSTYYDSVKRMNRPDRDVDLKTEIKAIYEEHEGRYGYRLIRDELANRRQKVNHKKVQRIMKELRLKCLVRMKKYKSYKGMFGKIAPNILDPILRQMPQIRSGQQTLRSLSYSVKSFIYHLF